MNDVSCTGDNLHDTSSIPGTMGSMPRWLSKDEQRAWRALLQMTAQLDAEVNRQLQAGGLSKADYDVLVPLSEATDGKLRIFAVGQALRWEQSRLSHHLARMQKRGLVEREECRSDRRGAFVVLTDAGREAIEAAAPAHVATVRNLVFDGLNREQVRTLAEVGETVLDRLQAARSAPASS
jgi:DNA-binding MarR family transcriptional regulator